MQCARAFAIFTRIDFPPFPVFYRARGKEGVDCEQSEQDGAVQYNHNHTARHPGAGRDPVGTPCQPVSFGIITQVDTAYQLDTARPRYDEYDGFSHPHPAAV